MQSQLVVLASPAEPWFDTLLRAHTGRIVAGLCVYAAIRILIFACAFPLFNITDEDSHFLAIRMFADGHLPGRELPPVDPTFEATYVLYGSPEYTHSQADLDRNGPRIPLYQLPPQARDAALGQTFYAQKFKDWSRKPNFEAQSPPLYYIIAAGWYDLGAALRIRDWGLLYWVRFLNPIAYALLVWLSYKFVRKVYPERAFLCLAVPGFQALFLVASSVLFLAAISLLFDFHDCLIPSRLRPFFVSGRIISGALLPFVLIYASGLELVVNRLRKWISPAAVLVLLMTFITVSEIVVRSPAFNSSYNFFALSAW